MASKRISFHADDLGMTLGANAGIREAYENGLLDTTSLMTNGFAFDDAVSNVVKKCKDLKVGLHINISQNPNLKGKLFGDKTRKKNSSILYKSFLLTFLLSFSKKYRSALEKEIRFQFEKAQLSVTSLDHANSHEYFCSIPNIFEIVCKLCHEYNIPKVRIVNEPFYLDFNLSRQPFTVLVINIIKWTILRFFAHFNKKIAKQYGLTYSDCFIGILFSNQMNIKNTKFILKKCIAKFHNIEILFHPAKLVMVPEQYYYSAAHRNYCLSTNRYKELKTLTSGELQNFLNSNMCIDFTQKKTADSSAHKRKIFCIFEEDEFFHPNLLENIFNDKDVNIVGAAFVKYKGPSFFKKYFLRNIRNLGLINLLNLVCKSWASGFSAYLPNLGTRKKYSSCESFAKQFKIPYRMVDEVNNLEFRNWVSKCNPDFIISSNSQIFKSELLSIPRVACLNRHSSLLPSNKGILPVFRSIEFGQQFTGVTIHKMTARIDDGDIVAQFSFPIFKTDTIHNIHKVCFDISSILIHMAIRSDQKPLETISPYPASYNSFPDNNSWKKFNSKKIRFAKFFE